jgi:hypothetical protein
MSVRSIVQYSFFGKSCKIPIRRENANTKGGILDVRVVTGVVQYIVW